MFSERLKRSIYVAHRTVNENGVFVYSEPVEYRVNCYNVLPNSASADLATIGTSISDVLQIVGPPDYLTDIQPFDRVYVNNPVPETTDPLAKGADYVVMAPPLVSPLCSKFRLKTTVE